LLRDHPLLTPLLVVYAAINGLAVVFEFGLPNAPINLVLLVVCVSVIRLATRDRPPGNSLAISSMAFGLSHVPSYLAAGNSLGLSLAIGLFGLLPGLLLGYVFYRARSIWPGAIWHTSISGVALLFWPHI